MSEPKIIGHLQLDGWCGRTSHDVEVIGFTPKRYRIRAIEDVLLPSRRFLKAGQIALVPQYAVRDNCTICQGKKGGTPGNENIIAGIRMCDYCHAARMKVTS